MKKSNKRTADCDDKQKVTERSELDNSHGKPQRMMQTENSWVTTAVGEMWPEQPLVAAPISMVPAGHPQYQYVALWFAHGIPTMGRAWRDGNNGRVHASFIANGREIVDPPGPVQVLLLPPDHMRTYNYQWLPAMQALNLPNRQLQQLVYVDKFVPCIINVGSGGQQLLGQLNKNTQEANTGDGTGRIITGTANQPHIVGNCLCRTAKPGLII